MRIIQLAKELGVPYERLLSWCRGAGMEYASPEEEITEGHARLARTALTRSPVKSREPSDLGDDEALLDELEAVLGKDPDLALEDLPSSLEELETLEQEVFKNTHRAGPKKPKARRLIVAAILDRFGLNEKALRKKIRKLLPEDISRLLNRESLAEEQARDLERALEEKLVLWCGDPACKNLLKTRYPGRDLVATRVPSVCRACEGSAAKRNMEVLAEACRDADITRLVIVGGSPAAHNEITALKPQGLSLRLVEGDVNQDLSRAAANMEWCDLAVIWAGTILSHAVSQNYTRFSREKTVVVNRRSVEALCEAIVEWVRRRIS